MNKIVFGIVAVVASFMLVESLNCNKCKFGLVGVCLNSDSETCTSNTSVCFTGRATFNVSGLMSLQTRGCLASRLCNQTESSVLLTAGCTVTRTCCSTDRCNGASSIRLPPSAALAAALVAVRSNWSL
ncbi:Hypothetical protein SMAX5B_015576 [Scophthalmus maximus]|uniref:UPAR/Ly6 domain-containing protein n=1 Tax=Scophthalmus maximus TaxID=52904 RepID=A0A2U9CXV5_SCOMX|nr:Hypothetical protein SMAX5B_015576 [Scophthalmus maximus]